MALVTIFARGDEPDVAATARRARQCVERGVTSVLVAGTTGEAWRLSADARVEVAGAVHDAVGDVPVIVGTGDPEEARALDLTGKVVAAGVADALLVYVPARGDPRRFLRAVAAEAGTVPLLAYHNPALPSLELDTGVVPELGVAGIKDSSADTNRLADLLELGVEVYTGSATQVALAGGCGAAGALLAVANVAPSLCVAAWNGDMTAQRELFGVHRRATADFPAYLKSLAPDGV